MKMGNKETRAAIDAIKLALGIKSPGKEEYATAAEVEEVINNIPDPNSIDNGASQDCSGACTDAEEEWVWVTGYKGMNKDMKCHNDFQYELGKRYDMPEGAKVAPCSSGFHLCLNLADVFHYVTIGVGNRFFEVRALVRKKDLDEYGTTKTNDGSMAWYLAGIRYEVNKLAAKSIEIVRELTVDEILAETKARDWNPKYKNIWVTSDYDTALKTMQTDELVNDCGYSFPFAQYLVENKKYDIAKAMASIEGLSMDMRVYCIMK